MNITARTRFFLLVIVFLLGLHPVTAQIEMANAIDIGYPIMTNGYNSKVNFGQVMSGLRFGISYKSTNVHFFPTLYYSVGFMRLPLAQFGNNVLSQNIGYMNLLLNQNIVFDVGQRGNLLYLIGGIGAARLKAKGLYIGGPGGDADKETQDSAKNVTRYFPALEFGIEYVYAASENSHAYISMGLNLEYIYILPNTNQYFATVENNQGKSFPVVGSMAGNAIVPSFSLCLHYLLGKNLLFWKKKDKFYL